MTAAPTLAAGIADVWPLLVGLVALGYLLGVVSAHRRARASSATAVGEVMDQLLESRRDSIHHQSRAAWLEHRLDQALAESEEMQARWGFGPGDSLAEAPDRPAGSNGSVTVDLRAGSERLGLWLRPDDLKVVDGIGPKIEVLLNEAGIRTWQELAERRPEEVAEILAAGGPRFRMHDPSTWPEQACLLARGEWAEFVRRTNRAVAGD